MDAVAADKLYKVLKRQLIAQEELRGLLQLQQQAIRRFDASALENLRQRGDVLAERIAELESARGKLTAPGARITELAKRMKEPQQSRTIAISLGLRKLAEENASLSRINHAAMQNMLNHFHSVYRMLAGANRPAAYGSSGESVGDDGGAFLVDAVA